MTNLSYPTKGIVSFCNGRGTAEQWIKEGKHAANWTWSSCHEFVANQRRLIKIGGRLVRHARGLVSQLAEVMVTRDIQDEMLKTIGWASSRS